MMVFGQNAGQNFENNSFLERELLNQFEKWPATRASMDGARSVLVRVAC